MFSFKLEEWDLGFEALQWSRVREGMIGVTQI